MSEKNDIPMIPQHQAETQAMHLLWAIRCIAIVAVSCVTALVIAILVFVNGYTARTKDWLNTLAQMQGQPAVTEVDNGVQQPPSP